MKILCKNTQIPMAASQQVNRVGKYLYKHLEGAFKYTTSSNTCDVYVTLLYQLKPEFVKHSGNEVVIDVNWKFCPFCGRVIADETAKGCDYCSKPDEYDDVHEMTININITTYQNKLRVNTIEMTPAEKTLGFDLIPPEVLTNLEEAKHIIINKVGNRIRRAYKDYDIMF